MQQGKLGRIYRVENKEHQTGEADYYNFVRVENSAGGDEHWLCLTDFDLASLAERARKNKEDWPRVSKIIDLLD